MRYFPGKEGAYAKTGLPDPGGRKRKAGRGLAAPGAGLFLRRYRKAPPQPGLPFAGRRAHPHDRPAEKRRGAHGARPRPGGRRDPLPRALRPGALSGRGRRRLRQAGGRPLPSVERAWQRHAREFLRRALPRLKVPGPRPARQGHLRAGARGQERLRRQGADRPAAAKGVSGRAHRRSGRPGGRD